MRRPEEMMRTRLATRLLWVLCSTAAAPLHSTVARSAVFEVRATHALPANPGLRSSRACRACRAHEGIYQSPCSHVWAGHFRTVPPVTPSGGRARLVRTAANSLTWVCCAAWRGVSQSCPVCTLKQLPEVSAPRVPPSTENPITSSVLPPRAPIIQTPRGGKTGRSSSSFTL